MSIFRRKSKQAKPPWRKCQLVYCDCINRTVEAMEKAL